jgi:hypothetical protein
MPGLTTLQRMKKVLMQGLFVAAVTALIGFQGTGVAAYGPRLWSIVVHFEYQDGSELDYVLEQGVPTAELGAALAECGRSHSVGSVVRYHCYPVAE